LLKIPKGKAKKPTKKQPKKQAPKPKKVSPKKPTKKQKPTKKPVTKKPSPKKTKKPVKKKPSKKSKKKENNPESLPTIDPIYVEKLPKIPVKDQLYVREVSNPKIGSREVTFRATGKKGFGKFKIIQNKPFNPKKFKITVRKKQ